MSNNDFNCINLSAARFGERVTITAVSSNGAGKTSVTVDSDDPLYEMFLAVADHELLWTWPPQPRDAHAGKESVR